VDPSNFVVARALARWTGLHGYAKPLPTEWVRNVFEFATLYRQRLDGDDVGTFEEDLFRAICCFGSTLLFYRQRPED